MRIGPPASTVSRNSVGEKLEVLAQRWNQIVYGDPNAEGFDFKLNLDEVPFESAVRVSAGKNQ
jgi:hypothetical protein